MKRSKPPGSLRSPPPLTGGQSRGARRSRPLLTGGQSRGARRSRPLSTGGHWRWWHAGLFAAAFAATLVAASPARWAAAAVERASDGRVRIAAATGTAWAGRGDVVVRTSVGEVTLQGAAWRWLPARVLAGELAFEVRADVAGPRMVVAWGVTGAVLRGADAMLFHRRPA